MDCILGKGLFRIFSLFYFFCFFPFFSYFSFRGTKKVPINGGKKYPKRASKTFIISFLFFWYISLSLFFFLTFFLSKSMATEGSSCFNQFLVLWNTPPVTLLGLNCSWTMEVGIVMGCDRSRLLIRVSDLGIKHVQGLFRSSWWNISARSTWWIATCNRHAGAYAVF